MRKLIASISMMLMTSVGYAETAAPFAMDKVILSINGIEITTADLLAYRDSRPDVVPLPADPKKAQDQIIGELVTTISLSEKALKDELDKSEKIQSMIEMTKRIVLRDAALENLMKSQTASEEEIKAAYNEQYIDISKLEYKARHILVKEKEAAEDLIKKLDEGADFIELAKQHSTGPSGKDGGDLGWFTPDMMVKPFSESISKLEKTKYTQSPVKTDFGWHVILLEDSRAREAVTPPSYEDVMSELAQEIKNDKVRTYLAQMRSQAKITVPEQKPAVEEKPKEIPAS